MMTVKYLMRHAMALVSLMMAGLALGGCDEAEYPQLCLFKAEAGVVPDMLDPDSCPGNFKVEDGEAFFILSVLPDDVIAPAPLHVTLKTPCATVELDQEYTLQQQMAEGGVIQRSRALIPVTAPRGSSCSLVVTASVANYRGQQSSHGGAESCATLGAECVTAISLDAGADAPDAGDGGP